MKPLFETFEHTADLGVRVKGRDARDLFWNAGLAVFQVIAACPPALSASVEYSVSVEAANREELLVAWLNELLSLSAAKGVIFTGIVINSIDDTGIKAVAEGVPAEACEIKTEIKAVTYHKLSVTSASQGWQAQFICDL